MSCSPRRKPWVSAAHPHPVPLSRRGGRGGTKARRGHQSHGSRVRVRTRLQVPCDGTLWLRFRYMNRDFSPIRYVLWHAGSPQGLRCAVLSPAPQARDVVSRAGKSEFDARFDQASQAEATQAALFFPGGDRRPRSGGFTPPAGRFTGGRKPAVSGRRWPPWRAKLAATACPLSSGK
jgi:hypothetical protein